MKHISAQELKQKMDENNNGRSYVIIDVREDHEWDAAHVEGTFHIPLGEVEERMDEMSQYDDVYIHCLSGGRSATACEMLEEKGIKNAINIEGGIMAMQRAGFRIVS